MLVKYERIEKHLIKTRPQARKIENDAELDRLGDSLAQGQLQPVGVMRDLTMIWGHRRLAAAMLKKCITHLWAAVFEEEITEGEFLRLRAVENFQRSDLTPYQQWLTAEELMKFHAGKWQQKDLATALSLDGGSVTRLLSPGRCIPAVQDALAGGMVSIADCYQFSLAGEKQQQELLALRLGGTTRDEIVRLVKQSRSGTPRPKKERKAAAPAIGLSRVKIALPGRAAVSLQYEGDRSLADIAQMLADTLEQMRAAIANGDDVTAWQQKMTAKGK